MFSENASQFDLSKKSVGPGWQQQETTRHALIQNDQDLFKSTSTWSIRFHHLVKLRYIKIHRSFCYDIVFLGPNTFFSVTMLYITPSNHGKWRFSLGSQCLKLQNPGGDYYWEGGNCIVIIVLRIIKVRLFTYIVIFPPFFSGLFKRLRYANSIHTCCSAFAAGKGSCPSGRPNAESRACQSTTWAQASCTNTKAVPLSFPLNKNMCSTKRFTISVIVVYLEVQDTVGNWLNLGL